ncbi:aldo/keto reductase, partial [Schumannella luteola]
PGSRNPQRAAQNIAAAELELTPADLARIAEIAPTGGITGP